MARVCIKHTIVFFNVILMAIGAASLGVGIWILTSDETFMEEVSDVLDLQVLGSDLLGTISMALITAGGVVFVLGTIGCAGAISMCSNLLVFYSMTLVVLLTLEVAVLVLVIVYRSEISKSIDDEMYNRLITRYGNDTSFTTSFDALQEEFECCGWGNGNDFMRVPPSLWNRTTEDIRNMSVPQACCQTSDKTVQLDCAVDQTYYTSDFNSTVYSEEGCKAKVEDRMERYTWTVIGMTIALLAFQFLLINLSLCLVVKNVGKKYNM